MLKTKQDFVQWMYDRLNPLRSLYSKDGARLCIGGAGAVYSENAVYMEGFSRPLWGLIPFWKGGGQDEEFASLYRRGLAAGTDRSNREYWGDPSDGDQRYVEMAAISCGLIFTPEILWQPLTAQQKKNLSSWLATINDHRLPDCNWLFFRVLVNLALKRLGAPYRPDRMQKDLERIDTFYLGEGWYRDGDSFQKDYYISFAMHYYGLLYAVAMRGEDPERCERFRTRAERFAQDFIYWFAPDGAAIPYGRSLTYRFGQAAFWSAYVFAGCQGVSHGVIKGILSRHLEWWSTQQITDRDGVLTVGYAYPNLIMAERYNAPGSPYWGMKTMLCLALPDDHPFWSANNEPLPELKPLYAIVQADMLIQHCGRDTVAYPGGGCSRYGHGHVPEKYSKFAYSTHFGFSCARSQIVLNENCPDSMLAFVIDGSDYVFVRESSLEWKVTDSCVVSTWSPFPGITVKTTITPTETGHMRRHEVESVYSCTAYDCGFAVQKFCAGYAQCAEANSATVENAAGGCTVCGKGEGCFVGADPNTNLLYKNTEIPALRYRIKTGFTVLETCIIAWSF